MVEQRIRDAVDFLEKYGRGPMKMEDFMNTSNTKAYNALDHPDMFKVPEEGMDENLQKWVYDVQRGGKSASQRAANKRERRNRRDGRRQKKK